MSKAAKASAIEKKATSEDKTLLPIQTEAYRDQAVKFLQDALDEHAEP